MKSPYLRTDEAAEYLRFTHKDGTPDRKGLWQFLKAKKVRIKKRGSTVLVHRDDLDATLTDGEARA